MASLGLDKPLFEPKEKRPPKKSKESKKRKAQEEVDSDDQDPAPARKLLRNDSDTPTSSPTPQEGPRRSKRNAGKILDYNKPTARSMPERAAYTSGVKILENDGPMGREDGKRKHSPYVAFSV